MRAPRDHRLVPRLPFPGAGRPRDHTLGDGRPHHTHAPSSPLRRYPVSYPLADHLPIPMLDIRVWAQTQDADDYPALLTSTCRLRITAGFGRDPEFDVAEVTGGPGTLFTARPLSLQAPPDLAVRHAHFEVVVRAVTQALARYCLAHKRVVPEPTRIIPADTSGWIHVDTLYYDLGITDTGEMLVIVRTEVDRPTVLGRIHEEADGTWRVFRGDEPAPYITLPERVSAFLHLVAHEQ